MSRAKLLKGKIFFHGKLYSAGDVLPDTPETIRFIRADMASLIHEEHEVVPVNAQAEINTEPATKVTASKPKASKKK